MVQSVVFPDPVEYGSAGVWRAALISVQDGSHLWSAVIIAFTILRTTATGAQAPSPEQVATRQQVATIVAGLAKSGVAVDIQILEHDLQIPELQDKLQWRAPFSGYEP
jgi:hypothetical protein